MRENLFDVAKLANCGMDVHARMVRETREYLRTWGRSTRAALETLRGRPSCGYFAPSCLAHASNLRFSSAPTIRGVRLLDAMHAWYFAEGAGAEGEYLLDDCGELPCSVAAAESEQQCPRLDSVRECHALCRLKRRRRRIRIGLNPSAPGRHVCELDEAAARESKQNVARRRREEHQAMRALDRKRAESARRERSVYVDESDDESRA